MTAVKSSWITSARRQVVTVPSAAIVLRARSEPAPSTRTTRGALRPSAPTSLRDHPTSGSGHVTTIARRQRAVPADSTRWRWAAASAGSKDWRATSELRRRWVVRHWTSTSTTISSETETRSSRTAKLIELRSSTTSTTLSTSRVPVSQTSYVVTWRNCFFIFIGHPVQPGKLPECAIDHIASSIGYLPVAIEQRSSCVSCLWPVK